MFVRFFIIQFILLIICFFVGKNIKNRKSDFPYIFLFIVGFSVIEGLRFGRGIDYNVYYHSFKALDSGAREESSAFFYFLLCKFISYFDLPYQYVIFINSLILSVAGVLWLRRFPLVMIISLPWFYLLSFAAENIFRWYTSFSFVLLALPFFLNRRYVPFLILSVVACGFHIMMIIPIGLFVLICLKKRILLDPIIVLVIYTGTLIIWSSEYMENFVFLANYALSYFDTYSEMYGGDMEAWLNGTQNGLIEFSITRQVFIAILFFYLIFVGKKIVNLHPWLIPYYNIMSTGILLYPIYGQIELLNRFGQLFLFFQCIIGAYCIFYSFKNLYLRRRFLLWSLVVVFYISYSFYSRLTPKNEYFTYYIWDAEGAEYFPVEKLDSY